MTRMCIARTKARRARARPGMAEMVDCNEVVVSLEPEPHGVLRNGGIDVNRSEERRTGTVFEHRIR
eukprot:3527896-Rhodomonas_salina.1